MVVKGARAAKGVLDLWVTDRGTFPVILLCGVAMTAAIGNGVRHLMKNPDVCVSKDKRISLRYSEEQGTEWQSKRRNLANLQDNAINQAFAKEAAKK